jgi:hypothetical protein
MPVHDGSRSDQDEKLPPPGPERSQRNPEQLVQGSQSSARSFRVQSQQLPTESQVFEDEVLAGAENPDHSAEEMSERHDHGKNPIGNIRLQVIHFAGVRRFGEAQLAEAPKLPMKSWTVSSIICARLGVAPSPDQFTRDTFISPYSLWNRCLLLSIMSRSGERRKGKS